MDRKEHLEDMSPGHQPTYFSIDVPAGIGQPLPIPPDNPLTVEGVELGRYLFYEKKLSRDNTIACGCCHKQEAAFADPGRQFSTGIDGHEGKFNAMAIINMLWQKTFFWDGRSHSLEHQAFFPVIDPDEMGEDWDDVIQKLQSSLRYPTMFKAAFGDETVSQERIVKAIAQFQRILVSGNSKFDKVYRRESSFSQLEAHGFDLFTSEKGDCQHCHFHTSGIFGAYGAVQFSNNGLDEPGTMKEGRYAITGDPEDYGKFKIPTLRNIILTSPYMHDGRFSTLREVIEHYNEGGKPSPTIDPNMKYVGIGLRLSEYDKQALEAFLQTLTDEDFVLNPNFSDPFVNEPGYVQCP